MTVTIRDHSRTILGIAICNGSIVIAGHKTSVSLEDEFWNGLKEIAAERGMTLAALVAAIDADREHANLSSAIRLFLCLASIAISVAESERRWPGSNAWEARLRSNHRGNVAGVPVARS